MSHALASDIPSLASLVQEHALYMSRLAEHERDFAFSSCLNITALLIIASDAVGSDCCSIDKIYQGKQDLVDADQMIDWLIL